MKKFTFSLGRMRDYKERLLEEEQGTLQRLKNEQAQLQHRIDRLDEAFQQLSRRMEREQAEGVTALEMRGYSLQLESTRLQLRELRGELKKAAERVAAQTRIVVAAHQEVSKLDKLEDRQYETYREQVNKAEEQRVEELVVQRLSRQDVG